MIETPAVPAQTKRIELPPRPNLGPEPWSRPKPSIAVVAASGFSFLIFAFLSLILARRRRRVRTKSEPTIDANHRRTPLEHAAEVVVWSEQVRALLVARFGPAWNAKTTEEVLSSGELISRLDPERLDRLSILLRAADLAKFAEVADPIPADELLAALEDLEKSLKAS